MRLESCYLPSDRDLILVAFSGGPDSTALLHQLHAGGCAVHAAHVHHGLRGEEADEDAAYCADFCRERNIPFTLIRVDVSGERESGGGGVQEVARQLRYAALERCASEVGASIIATAHNRDDNAETILLNILRGTGTDGLRGIPERRGRIVRPLLEVSRAEIETYCAEEGLEPRRDSSNDSTKYSRNEVRHKLIPYLRERFNPAVTGALSRLSIIARDESAMLDALATEWLQPAWILDSEALAREPVALQRRVIRLWLTNVADLRDVGFDAVETIRGSLGQSLAQALPRIVLEGNRKSRWRATPADNTAPPLPAPAPIAIKVPGAAIFGGWEVAAQGRIMPAVATIVRNWVAGDRMRFSYGRKKLKSLFQEARTPVPLRWTIPLLVEQEAGEVIAIANDKVSDLHPELRFTAEWIETKAG